MSDEPGLSSDPDSTLRRRPLVAQLLEQALVSETSFWKDVVVLKETPSTNAVLAERARAGAPEGTLVTTDHQTAGRGRLDRTWEMPVDAAIAVSVLVRPAVEASRWTWLPLLTGTAAVATTRDVGVEASLKWPNDVVVEDRKLGGILVERIDTPQGPAAVIGCGINVSVTAEEIGVPDATSLVSEGSPTADLTGLVSSYARAFEAAYLGWTSVDGDPDQGLRATYEHRSATIGQPVVVTFPDGTRLTGLATGIDAHGRLEVRHDGETTAVSAGDVTHVRSAP